jgi:hypothetical protein
VPLWFSLATEHDGDWLGWKLSGEDGWLAGPTVH